MSSPAPDQPAPTDLLNNRRKRGRVKTSRLKCSLGRITDISGTGMRVAGTGFGPSQGSEMTVRIFGEEEKVSVQGKVVWLKRRLFRFEAGLEFTGLSANARRSIAEIARMCSSSMLEAHRL